jgi:hypothetical protein
MFTLKRLRAPIGIAALLMLASSAPTAAQVWYPGPGYPGYPFYPAGRYAAPDASVKFKVEPNDAAVYVDGYFAGIVDDFDGVFQRLYTAPGGHEVTVYLEGYRTYSQRVYLAPDRTFKFSHEMEKLPAGQTAEKPPAPATPPPDEERPASPQFPQGPFGRRGPPSTRRLPPPPDAQQPPSSPAERSERGSSRGTLELNLQPSDAEVLVDGQPWRGSGQDRLTIDLSDGRHNIQVRKAGYVGYLTDVTIRSGETISLNVNLRTQPPR